MRGGRTQDSPAPRADTASDIPTPVATMLNRLPEES